MFTWICPQCGREVPPAYNECPDCAARAAQPAEAPAPVVAAAAPPADAPRPGPPPAYAPPPLAPVPMQQVPMQSIQMPPQRSGFPAWLMSIVFALAFLGLGAGVYWGVNYFRGGATGAAPATVENPAAKGSGKPHPLQKYIEIAGMRFMGDKKGTEAKFLVINHSNADILDLAMNVTIWGRTQRSEEDAVGTVSVKVPAISAESAKEVTAPVVTKLKIYEMPDWQNVTTDVRISSPPAE